MPISVKSFSSLDFGRGGFGHTLMELQGPRVKILVVKFQIPKNGLTGYQWRQLPFWNGVFVQKTEGYCFECHLGGVRNGMWRGVWRAMLSG